MKIGSQPQVPEQVKSDQGQQPQAQEDKEVADRFQSLVSGKKDKGKKGEKDLASGGQNPAREDKLTSKEKPPHEQTAADSILRSMGFSGEEGGQKQILDGSKGQGIEQSSKLGEVVDEIVSRILVSDTDLSGKQEVRISLQSKVLPSTEVSISKQGGTVTIELTTSSDSAQKEINRHIDGLRLHLQEKIKDDIVVRTTMSESDAGSDGRSRQQRNLYDELEE